MRRQRTRTWRRDVLAAQALLLAAACHSAPRQAPQCSADADCGDAGVCVAGQCTPTPGETVPACEFSVEALDFGPIALGAYQLLEVRVLNRRDDEQHPAVFEIDGSGGFAFGRGFDPNAQTVPRSQGDQVGWVGVPVRFTPTRIGPSIGTLRIDAPDFCEATISLSGTGVSDQFTCEPQIVRDGVPICRVDFGYAYVSGRTSRDLVFRNFGPSPVMVTAAGVSATFGTDLAILVVGAGMTNHATVFFSPPLSGPRSGTLAYSTDDPLRPFGEVELVGVGGGPRIYVTPAAVDFGVVGIETDQIRSMTIWNDGVDVEGTDEDNLRIGTAQDGAWLDASPEIIGRDAADYMVLGWPGSYTNAGLRTQESVTLAVRFAPLSVGKKSASLVVRSSDGVTPEVLVGLSGVAADLPPCDLEVVPPALDFGTVPGFQESILAFSLRNRSTTDGEYCQVSPLHFVSSDRSEPFQFVEGSVGELFTLDPGEKLDVPVSFKPAFEGDYQSYVEFFSSSRSRPKVRIPLVGKRRGGYSVTVTPRDREFGAPMVGCSTDGRVYSVANSSQCEQTLERVELAPSPYAVFAVAPPPLLPVQLGSGGGGASFEVRYQPVFPGLDWGAVVLTGRDNCGNGPWTLTVPLRGHGTTRTRVDTIIAVEPRLDLLFVLDNGPTMVDKQAALATNLAALAQYLLGQPIDLHLGVTTTDSSPTGEKGRLVPTDGSRPKVVTRATPNAAAVFAQNANVGTGGSAARSLLASGYMAITEPLVRGANAGFLRDPAYLALLVVSDSPDVDPLGLSVSQYEGALLQSKCRECANALSFSAIVPTLSVPPEGCSYSSATAADDTRASDLAGRLAGMTEEICNPTWSAALVGFLDAKLSRLRARFYLSEPPDTTQPISVRVDGQTVPEVDADSIRQWRFDPAINALVFEAPAVPSPGAEVTVEYLLTCKQGAW